MLKYPLDTERQLSVALAEQLHGDACRHLLRADGQEDLTFGLWRPSEGDKRTTALLAELLLPRKGERRVHGNASFEAHYLERALVEAQERGMGLAFLHSHPAPGWQGMSADDIVAEQERIAKAALSMTGLPVLGLTVGTDGTWSARFWPRVAPRTYQRRGCASVRVVGQALRVSYDEKQIPKPRANPSLLRTVSAWGLEHQANLARLHVGVVGLGSVGSIVVETLARIGVQNVTVLDFDEVERLNLDRILGALKSDARLHRLKTFVAARLFRASATAFEPRVREVAASVVEPEGYAAALNCDVLFSCVDRPWARSVLNHIAYAHLIPVIDGGIIVRVPRGKFKGAEWSLRTVGPSRACLACVGQYASELVSVEQAGLLDTPSYIQQLDEGHPLRRNENIFPFSLNLASFEVLQLVALVTGLKQMHEIGEQRVRYFPPGMDVEVKSCRKGCPFPALVAKGDDVRAGSVCVTGRHAAAEQMKQRRRQERKNYTESTIPSLVTCFSEEVKNG
jgi:hypothetical protein